MMKALCSVLVLLAVFQASLCRNLENTRAVQRSHQRTPFNLRQRANVSPSIVGGHPAAIEDFPHHLGLIDLDWGGYICGASNISPRWAISAAHCLEWNVPALLINLWGGSTSIVSGGIIFFVDEYILHPQYDDWTLDNDIAVLHVSVDSQLTGHPHVSPIALPPNCATLCCGVCVAGPDITVAGWGVYNQVTGDIPDDLLQVQKPIHDHAACNAVWGGITSSMFCTTAENGIDSCSGDSGSAIIREGIQVGVVSFGSRVCGDGSAPAVYVRVEAPVVRDFIRTNTGV